MKSIGIFRSLTTRERFQTQTIQVKGLGDWGVTKVCHSRPPQTTVARNNQIVTVPEQN